MTLLRSYLNLPPSGRQSPLMPDSDRLRQDGVYLSADEIPTLSYTNETLLSTISIKQWELKQDNVGIPSLRITRFLSGTR